MPCKSSRLFVVGTDGHGAHEVISDGNTNQVAPVWSPDGTRLLYFDEGKLYLIDPSGGGPQPVDTGCAAPCLGDSQVAFSSDGASLAFIRESEDPSAHTYLATVATMDLASGRVVELRSTGSDASAAPGWSPDGTQIVYFRAGEKDGGGPNPPRLDAIWLVDADGNGLRQLSPTTLAAAYPKWSPDGARILFESIDGEQQDIYTIRPDGTDVRRLTTDGVSVSATWTPDGRILFVRPGGASPGWWTMNADGTDAALLIADAEVGPVAGRLLDRSAGPTWQPVGGAALVPPPWKAATGVAVGPPAPTPVPTPVPELAPGFAWTGSMATAEGGPLGESATPLADGRVLFAGGCSTAAELYDPATGTFTPTGDMTAVRGGSPATLLLDGRVLFTGGYNCGPAGQDGIWASAELYDPATGTFSPTGSMGTPREFQTATRLADGRVLIAGGYTAASPSAGTGITLASYRLVESAASVLKTAEVYDPATGTFSRTGSMSSIRNDHTATLLQDGRVLVIGGGGEGYASQKTADLYDPATGKFSRTGSMKTGRWLHTATLLQDGRVLVTGGRSPQDSVYKSAETYDPATGRFSSAGSMGDGPTTADRDASPRRPSLHRRRLLERRPEVPGPLLDGDVRPGGREVQLGRLDGRATLWTHRDAAERRPGPHRRWGREQRWGRGHPGGALPAVAVRLGRRRPLWAGWKMTQQRPGSGLSSTATSEAPRPSTTPSAHARFIPQVTSRCSWTRAS